MRYKQLISGTSLLWTCIACSGKKEQAVTVAEAPPTPWDNYYIGEIDFRNLSPEAKGSAIYAAIIPDSEIYITKHARKVVETLYFAPEDSIPSTEEIHYTLKECDGVSAKDGMSPSINIVYSTKWIEESFANNDTMKVDYETRGVLYHELTHGFQLEPQDIGSYGTNKTFWAVIEGVADAVRYLNGGFTLEDRPKGGHYMNGCRTTGSFLAWLTQTENPDFLRKLSRGTLEVISRLFNGGVKYVLGNDYDIDSSWKEYMATMGDETWPRQRLRSMAVALNKSPPFFYSIIPDLPPMGTMRSQQCPP